MSAAPKQRPNAGVYDDPDYDQQKHDPGLADDVLEMVADSRESNRNYAESTHGPDAVERERIKRDERRFLEALPRGINEQLRGQRIIATRAIPDGTGNGYRIYARDAAGRPYECVLTLDEMMAMGAVSDGMGRSIIRTCCERLLAERARYFARMQ